MLTYWECCHLATDGAKYWLGLVARQMIYTLRIRLEIQRCFPQKSVPSLLRYNLMHVNSAQVVRVEVFTIWTVAISRILITITTPPQEYLTTGDGLVVPLKVALPLYCQRQA